MFGQVWEEVGGLSCEWHHYQKVPLIITFEESGGLSRKSRENRMSKGSEAQLIQRSLATLARAVLMELRGRRPDSIEKAHEWGVQKIETHFKKTVHAGSARDKWATTRGGFPASEFTRT